MGGGENSLEDQLWRSSLGLSSGSLKEGKEVRDDDSLGTSGHSWGHLLPQSAPRQIRFGASLLKCSLRSFLLNPVQCLKFEKIMIF